MTSDALKVAPPHRVEHKAVKDPVRGAGDSGDRTATEVVTPKFGRARTRRGGNRGRGGGGVGAVPPPTTLALAIQVMVQERLESVITVGDMRLCFLRVADVVTVPMVGLLRVCLLLLIANLRTTIKRRNLDHLAPFPVLLCQR